MKRADFFICHASPDKEAIVEPLYAAMLRHGLTAWFDRAEIPWGGSLHDKIRDGLTRASFAVVILSEAFLDPEREWAPEELKAILSRKFAREITVLPILVADPKLVFRRYPFLRDVLHKVWDGDADRLARAMLSLTTEQHDRYLKAVPELPRLPLLDGLAFRSLSFGEGPTAVTYDASGFVTFPPDLTVPRKHVAIDGHEAYTIKDLLPPDWARAYKERSVLVPRDVRVEGVRSDPDHPVALFHYADQVYVLGIDERGEDGTFSIPGTIGRAGISNFVHPSGELIQDHPFVIGDGIGSAGLLVAVEFAEGQPVGRTPHALTIRKGIRYPDDAWCSAVTGGPIVPPGTTDLTNARFIFQSWQPNGTSTDVFVEDYAGGNRCNLTRKDETRYDGLLDHEGREVARWLDDRTIEYSSMRDGARRLVQAQDCVGR